MENSEKKLSIIIPHKNDLERLERLINSIPKNDNLEIIVVDDHSDKFSLIKSSLEKYSNVSLYKNETNKKSAGTARNIGIEKAESKWILFADSDDYFLDSFSSEFEHYQNSDLEVIYFRPELSGLPAKVDCKFMGWYKELKKNDSKENLLRLKLNTKYVWSKLISLDFINQHNIRFDEVIKHNDTLFSQKIGIYSKKVSVEYTPIYHYDFQVGGITFKNDRDSFLSTVDVQSRNYRLLCNNYSIHTIQKIMPEILYMPFRLLAQAILKQKSYDCVKIVRSVWKLNGNWTISIKTLLRGLIAYMRSR